MFIIDRLAGKPGKLLSQDAIAGATTAQQQIATENSGQQATAQMAQDGKIFTQADVDRIIKERLARAEQKADAKVRAKLEELGLTPDEIEEYKEWKAKREQEEADRKQREGKFEELVKEMNEKTSAQIREAEERAIEAQLKLDLALVKNTITSLVAKYNGHSPDQVANLVLANFAVDDNDNVIVVDSEENPLIAPDGRPYTPETYIQDWLNKNPHFLKSTGGGSGYRAQHESLGKRIYRRSELRDNKFYNEHRDDIKAALREGRILDDTK